MGSHIVNGEFQSDKYPTCPPGKVPLSVKDPMAQDLLWEYARRRIVVDAEFSADLALALKQAGFKVPACTDCGGSGVIRGTEETSGGIWRDYEIKCPCGCAAKAQ